MSIEIIVTDESVTVAGVSAEHNDRPWRTAKNRHPNTDGTAWGCIDGAPGNVCWSDNECFNSAAAAAMVRAHNAWLDDQQPLSIKIIKAKREYEAALEKFNEINSAHSAALAAMNKARLALEHLRAQKRTSGREGK